MEAAQVFNVKDVSQSLSLNGGIFKKYFSLLSPDGGMLTKKLLFYTKEIPLTLIPYKCILMEKYSYRKICVFILEI